VYDHQYQANMHNPVFEKSIAGKANIQIWRDNGLQGTAHHHEVNDFQTPVTRVPK
jgi:hypothetical protein